MERKETIEFMQRIKSHYQEFIIDDFKIDEWHKELKRYDYEDINKKFEEHLKSEVYGEQIPKLYFLTKYLTPTEDKNKKVNYDITCRLCGLNIPADKYDEHYDRCCGANVIVSDIKKYFNLTVDYNQLMAMNDDLYEKTYIKYLNKMLEVKDLPTVRKRVILKCLYPDKDINIDELLKDLVGNE